MQAMLAIFNLKNSCLLESHISSIYESLSQSPHKHTWSSLSQAGYEAALHKLIQEQGLLLKASFGNETAGCLVAKRTRSTELHIIDFLVDPDFEPRIADVLFNECKRDMKRRDIPSMYCSYEWLQSVSEDHIREKFFQNKKKENLR